MNRNISIIMPVLNEGGIINSLITHLKQIDNGLIRDIIIVDADPGGSTLSMVNDKSILKLHSSVGRSVQMNIGAKAAFGDILLFLHADTRLPYNALRRVDYIINESGYSGGAFSLGIDNKSYKYRIIESTASIRSRLTRIPFGDQAIFIKKDVFHEIGMFSEIPIMEDVELMKRLKRSGHRISILQDKVSTSARRWEKNGVLVNTIRNWKVQILYIFGVNPEILARYYYSPRKRRSDNSRQI